MGSLGGRPTQAFTYLPRARVPDASAEFCFPSLTPFQCENAWKGNLDAFQLPKGKAVFWASAQQWKLTQLYPLPPKDMTFSRSKSFLWSHWSVLSAPMTKRAGL